MLKIKQTIIVEGKYDKIKLKSIVDANIITTDGFRIYNNSEKRALIKNIAEKTGIIILTDSDSAGQRIRNFIKNCVGDINLDGEKIINIYIPKISGKEKRKSESSKENIIGVEGIDKDLLIDVLKRFGVAECRARRPRRAVKNTKIFFIKNKKSISKIHGTPRSSCPTKKITKTDFYIDGLSGKENSTNKRKYLCERLDIPYMPSNSLLETVNILTDYDTYKKIIGEFDGEN